MRSIQAHQLGCFGKVELLQCSSRAVQRNKCCSIKNIKFRQLCLIKLNCINPRAVNLDLFLMVGTINRVRESIISCTVLLLIAISPIHIKFFLRRIYFDVEHRTRSNRGFKLECQHGLRCLRKR